MSMGGGTSTDLLPHRPPNADTANRGTRSASARRRSHSSRVPPLRRRMQDYPPPIRRRCPAAIVRSAPAQTRARSAGREATKRVFEAACRSGRSTRVAERWRWRRRWDRNRLPRQVKPEAARRSPRHFSAKGRPAAACVRVAGRRNVGANSTRCRGARVPLSKQEVTARGRDLRWCPHRAREQGAGE